MDELITKKLKIEFREGRIDKLTTIPMLSGFFTFTPNASRVLISPELRGEFEVFIDDVNEPIGLAIEQQLGGKYTLSDTNPWGRVAITGDSCMDFVKYLKNYPPFGDNYLFAVRLEKALNYSFIDENLTKQLVLHKTAQDKMLQSGDILLTPGRKEQEEAIPKTPHKPTKRRTSVFIRESTTGV